MFLPQDLTASEEDLIASVTRQIIERRAPQTPAEQTAAQDEATQVAAEMIYEARSQAPASTSGEDEVLEQDLAESPYHQRLARLRARNLEIQEAEDAETDAEIL